MQRALMIMRHAKSDWDTGTPDFDRPLARRGVEDASRMGRWLAQHGFRPDCVVSSPARRARDTTLAVCAAACPGGAAIRWDPTVYEASLVDLLAVLATTPSSAQLALLVGHNPGLEYLLRHLVACEHPQGMGKKLMPTAGVAVLVMPDDWMELGRGTARWRAFMRPKLLRSGLS
jgi:phosphohistidine phosphatase